MKLRTWIIYSCSFFPTYFSSLLSFGETGSSRSFHPFAFPEKIAHSNQTASEQKERGFLSSGFSQQLTENNKRQPSPSAQSLRPLPHQTGASRIARHASAPHGTLLTHAQRYNGQGAFSGTNVPDFIRYAFGCCFSCTQAAVFAAACSARAIAACTCPVAVPP